MSNRLLSLVWGAGTFGSVHSEPARRVVMLALADRVNDADGDFCYPGLQDIATRTRRGISTVKRALTALQQDGWLTITGRAGYGNVYTLNVEKLEAAQQPARSGLRYSSRLSRPSSGQPSCGPVSLTSPVEGLNQPTLSLVNRKNPKEPNASRRSRAAGATASRAQKQTAAGAKQSSALNAKPSDVQQPDPRHVPCRNAVQKTLGARGVPFSWGPAEAGQLSCLLRDTPALTEADFARWVQNLAASDDGAILKRPCKWLPDLQRYSQGPLDRFGCPKNKDPLVGPSPGRTALERYMEAS